jgi:hypothetical protein
VIPNVPNFILYLVFMPLSSQLQKLTGYDILGIDIKQKVRELSIPAYFMVANDDKISGKHDVLNLFLNYGSKHC